MSSSKLAAASNWPHRTQLPVVLGAAPHTGTRHVKDFTRVRAEARAVRVSSSHGHDSGCRRDVPSGMTPRTAQAVPRGVRSRCPMSKHTRSPNRPKGAAPSDPHRRDAGAQGREEKARRGAAKERSGKRTPEGLLHRVRQLLARPLRIVRRGLVLHVVLARAPSDAATTAPDPRPLRPAANLGGDPVALELRQIGKQLRHRLNRHALSRTVFAQLCIVERELGRHGYAVLRSLPVELLHAALEQLGCVTGQPAGELGTLRTKMLDAILARRSKAGDFDGHLALSVFDAPHKLEVHEAGASAFFHAEEEWTQRHGQATAR